MRYDTYRIQLPDTHRAVVRGTHDVLAVARPANGIHAAGMALQGMLEAASARRPDLHGLVRAGGREVLAIRREHGAGDRPRVPVQRIEQLVLHPRRLDVHRVGHCGGNSSPSTMAQPAFQRRRRGNAEVEDASQGKLGPEFQDAGCLLISEVHLFFSRPGEMTGEREAGASGVAQKTKEYVDEFSRYKEQSTIREVRAYVFYLTQSLD